MAIGVVKWFSDQKGYGFIQQDNGPNLFVHYKSINSDGFQTLKEGDRVSFTVEEDVGGPCAVNVTVITSEVPV